MAHRRELIPRFSADDELRDVAVRAVQAGMDVVNRWRERGDDVGARKTGMGVGDDYVTAVDDAAEAAVAEVLRRADPAIPVVGESAGDESGGELLWVVDPLDGTTGFVRGGSFVGVTVALLRDGRPVIGATGCPFTGELWSAIEGEGTQDAFGVPVSVAAATFGNARVALDPEAPTETYRASWYEALARLRGEFADVQLVFSTALGLAYVAGGNFDAFVHLGGSDIQEVAAGVLLVREGGGVVTGLAGEEDVRGARTIVAGTADAYRRVLAALRGL